MKRTRRKKKLLWVEKKQVLLKKVPSLGNFIGGEFFQNFREHMKLMNEKSFRAMRPMGVGSLTHTLVWDC